MFGLKRIEDTREHAPSYYAATAHRKPDYPQLEGDVQADVAIVGGGFSGAILDINDGTSNDYSSFYTHPYANGPTGSAGIQNANEILSSHCMIDCRVVCRERMP